MVVTCSLLACSSVVLAVALYFGKSKHEFGRAVILEPAGLSAALQAVPARPLTEKEKELLHEDGFLVLPQVIPNATLLKTLEENMWSSQFLKDIYSYSNPLLTNGALRALIRDGPFGSMASSAIGSPMVRTANLQVWGYLGSKNKNTKTFQDAVTVHADANISRNSTLYTLWFALTDAPHALRMFRYTHRLAQKVYDVCSHPKPCGPFTGRLYCLTEDCVANVTQAESKRLGRPSVVDLDLKAGDAVIFDGSFVHSSLEQDNPRLAVCMRLHDGHFPLDHEYRPLEVQEGCGSLINFIIHPRSKNTIECIDRSPAGVLLHTAPKCYPNNIWNWLFTSPSIRSQMHDCSTDPAWKSTWMR